MMTRVYLDLGSKKVFACALDWPGWCRIGTSEELALKALRSYGERYRLIAQRAGLEFVLTDFVVVQRMPGTATTDFGAPSAIPDSDAEPLDAATAQRQAALVRASWTMLDEVVAGSPQVLRKGPRGGGRDRDRMVAHVVEAERSYARKIGVRHKKFAIDDAAALSAMRRNIAEVLESPSSGDPVIARGWPSRYAARRIAWHVIDHMWQMQDG